MTATSELAGLFRVEAAVLLPAAVLLWHAERITNRATHSGRRLRDMARRSRAATQERREAVAAQEEAERTAWLAKVRATTEDAALRRTLTNRFKDVTP